jgi:hypothetical protein
VDRFARCRFLSLGSGGGSDVLQALEKGAAQVHVVEVIPQINRMMLVEDSSGYVVRDSTTLDSAGRIITCAQYSGQIYSDPRVKVVTEDARTHVRRHRGEFDVIYSLSSNTWAALGSGAFALAETYLFTTEAFKDYMAWLLLEVTVFPVVTGALSALPLAGRILATVLLITPLGFFMGMPFPRGVLRVGPMADWGFAVNGVGSVLGATLIVLGAFTFGFRVALLAGAGLYLAAFGLLAAERLWQVRSGSVPGEGARL